MPGAADLVVAGIELVAQRDDLSPTDRKGLRDVVQLDRVQKPILCRCRLFQGLGGGTAADANAPDAITIDRATSASRRACLLPSGLLPSAPCQGIHRHVRAGSWAGRGPDGTSGRPTTAASATFGW